MNEETGAGNEAVPILPARDFADPLLGLARGQTPNAADDSRDLLLLRLENHWPRQSTPPDPGPLVATLAIPPAQPPTSVLKFGPYLIERELGRGGFGVVLLGSRVRDGKRVALKIPRPELLDHSGLRQRFRQEADVMLSLDHPHIVRIEEVSEFEGIDYIASEFCPGGSLADWLAEKSANLLTLQNAAELILRIAQAVAHVHSRGMLHRDLKPSNILLGEIEEHRPAIGELPFVPLLTDFGLAKLVDQSLEQTGSSVLLGTPQYMAPEQAACRYDQIGPWTDVYALGAILYELLTGQLPHSGSNLYAVLTNVQGDSPRDPRQVRPDIPNDLALCCLKCLERESEDRYQDAAGFAVDLERFIAGERVSARPVSLARRVKRWCYNPKRIENAGRWMIGLHIIVLVWFALFVPYIAWSREFTGDRSNMLLSLLTLVAIQELPQEWLGWLILKRRSWAISLAPWLAGASLVFTIAGLLGEFGAFGGTYNDAPANRVFIFGLIGVLYLVQLVLCTCAAMAHKRGKEPLGRL